LMRKKKKKEIKKYIYIYIWEKKKKVWLCVKIKWTPQFSKVHYEFQGFKIKISILIFQPCAIR
jgi:hypothetical protein